MNYKSILFSITYTRSPVNTNKGELELYAILGEYDGAGFPLSYCLLSTALSIEINKRTQALTAWATKLRDVYDIHPEFVHTDKDMVEIAMARTVWNVKHQLCSWHLLKAVREWLSQSKLATTPYRPLRAQAQFSFIDPTFTPPGQPDHSEYEGNMPDTYVEPPLDNTPNLMIRIPAQPSIPRNTQMPDNEDEDDINSDNGSVGNSADRIDLDEDEDDDGGLDSEGSDEHPKQKLTIKLPAPSNIAADGKRIFCPKPYRKIVLEKMNKHLCAHPLIPGFSEPTASGIHAWAVERMYAFCVKHDLRELWAYLWENWYRSGWWELWARAPCAKFPRLKTTMILESQ